MELTLTALAPAGGAVVQLTSSNPAALPVPATVTVPAGQSQASVRLFYGQVTVPDAGDRHGDLCGIDPVRVGHGAPVVPEAPGADAERGVRRGVGSRVHRTERRRPGRGCARDADEQTLRC